MVDAEQEDGKITSEPADQLAGSLLQMMEQAEGTQQLQWCWR